MKVTSAGALWARICLEVLTVVRQATLIESSLSASEIQKGFN